MHAFSTLVRVIFSRRTMLTVAWVIAAIVVAVGINLIGIHIVGSVSGWNRWLDGHRWLFFAWRVCLYAGTGWSWWWMHRRVRGRETNPSARMRLLRAEIAIVLALVVMEGSVMLK